jgi:ubiquinone/menaquinone biosynthesis C-methylase UbiE
MSIYTTEIASNKLTSDNPIHQRLLRAYYVAEGFVNGDLLEIGCGEGRGVEILAPKSDTYTAVDKIDEVVKTLSLKFPKAHFFQANIPPLPFKDNSFNTVVSFQVIEHIKNDAFFLKEIYRVLKPKGRAYISTPNIKMTLSRNPWHIREYTAKELTNLCKKYFLQVKMKGIKGNKKVMEYYKQNEDSVNKIMRFDIFNFQRYLPSFLLKIPYEILNRRNRKKLQATNNSLVATIHHTDYLLSDEVDISLDLYAMVIK